MNVRQYKRLLMQIHKSDRYAEFIGVEDLKKPCAVSIAVEVY